MSLPPLQPRSFLSGGRPSAEHRSSGWFALSLNSLLTAFRKFRVCLASE